MRRIALLGALVLLVSALAAPASAGQDKSWVCHNTHSESNPIVVVHVAKGWDQGHGNQKVSKHQLLDEELFNYDGKAGPAAKRGVAASTCVDVPPPPVG